MKRGEARLTRSRDAEHDDCEECLDTSNDEVHHVGGPGWRHCDCGRLRLVWEVGSVDALEGEGDVVVSAQAEVDDCFLKKGDRRTGCRRTSA